MSSDPPHPVPRLLAGALIAELEEVADRHADTGLRYIIAVVTEPAFFTGPLTLITNRPEPDAREALYGPATLFASALLAALQPLDRKMPPGDLPP